MLRVERVEKFETKIDGMVIKCIVLIATFGAFVNVCASLGS